MQDKASQRPGKEREFKRTQRAVLSLVLHEFSAQLTRQDLKWRGFKGDTGLDQAISNLALVGLLWCEGRLFCRPSPPSLRLAGTGVTVAERFADNLVRARKQAGLTQEDVSFRAELNRTEISQLERGLRVPRIDTLVKLAASLGTGPADLLAGIVWRPGEFRPGRFTDELLR